MKSRKAFLTKPESFFNDSKIPGTLELHNIRRRWCMETGFFFHTAADELPFHEQWYRKYGDSDKSAYLELPLCFDPKMSSMP